MAGSMTQKQLLNLLKDEGWVLRRAKTGTHMTFSKEGHPTIITIKDRAGHDKIPKGALASIFRTMAQLISKS